ncbi:phage baseplate assembly protein V [Azospirillum sp. TSO22-1]|uniref:phage baseplate assembly protein V n=1 Tax=Azospirillum sp. TSO22-1 TaxID=716789 RepID=UPI000D65D9F0|nr:phage baseplate assembly protein V [Azospirillum sp. TSO22-1]
MRRAKHPPSEGPGRYYGKYRALVLDNDDPLKLGRVLSEVPALPGALLDWALPCAPAAGPLAVPPAGTSIWVEFEGGDPNFPIWSGRFWTEGEAPAPVMIGGTTAMDGVTVVGDAGISQPKT